MCIFLSYVVVKIRTSFRVIVPCFLATLKPLLIYRFFSFSSSDGRRRFVYKGMKRFIVLVSRDIPGPMKPTGGGGGPLQRHVSSSPLISFLHLAPNPPPLILLLPFFFNVRVDLQKEKQRKKARERKRGRKRKCIEMSYNKSKQLPVNFRHASRSSNATPQPGTIRGSTISDL